jgi:hypothetical protein
LSSFVEEILSNEAPSLEEISDVVSNRRGKLDSENLGGVFHPQRRDFVCLSESGGFVTVGKDDRVFTIQSKVFLSHLFFDSLDNTDLGLLDVTVEKISQSHLGSFDQTLVGEDEMLFGESQSGVGARSGDLESTDTMFDVRNSTRWVFALNHFLERHLLVLVGDLGVLMETR